MQRCPRRGVHQRARHHHQVRGRGAVRGGGRPQVLARDQAGVRERQGERGEADHRDQVPHRVRRGVQPAPRRGIQLVCSVHFMIFNACFYPNTDLTLETNTIFQCFHPIHLLSSRAH